MAVAKVFAGEGYLSCKLTREELGRWVLEHAPHELRALPEGELFGGMPRQHYLAPAIAGIIPSRQTVHQANDGCLAAARGAAEHHALARGDAEGHVIDGPGRPLVRKRDVAQREDLPTRLAHPITPFAMTAPAQATQATTTQAKSSAPAGRW